MRKRVIGALLCVLLLCLMLVACNASNAPTLSVDETGLASWQCTQEVDHFVAEIDGEEQVVRETSLQLQAGQSIRVKAVLTNGRETKYSKAQTYQHQHEWKQEPTPDNLAAAATCQSPATYYRVCGQCGEKGDTFAYGESDPNGHDWRVINTVAASCLAGGYDECECLLCHTAKRANETAIAPHDYTGVTPTYTLAEGSKSCLDGVVEHRTCLVCKQEQTREIKDNEHHYNITVYDLTQYGCTHSGTATERRCPCNEIDVDVDTTCLLQAEKNGMSVCGECGFRYFHERITLRDENCRVSIKKAYWYSASPQEEGLRIDCIKETDLYEHSLEKYDDTQETAEDGLRKVTQSYRIECTQCHTVTKYGYTARHYNGEADVIAEQADYEWDAGLYRGTVLRSIRTDVPYGEPGETIFLGTLSRQETRDDQKALVSWSQQETRYDADVCSRTVITTDSDGNQTEETQTEHAYRQVQLLTPNSCADNGAAVQRCIWCGNEQETKVAPFGHAYLWSDDHNCFVCLRCGRLSDQSIESIIMEDVTITQENKDFYCVRIHNTTADTLTPSAMVGIQTANGLIEKKLATNYIEDVGGMYRIKISEVSTLARKEGVDSYEYVRLSAGDNSIVLGHVYQYSFAQQATKLVRTATCVLCGLQSTSELPVVGAAPLTPVSLRSGEFVYSFVPTQSNVYRFYTTGCTADTAFHLYLYNDRWEMVSESYSNGEQCYLQLTLQADSTYYLVPSFREMSERPTVSLYAELYCNHQYQYQFVQNGNTITQTGTCSICHADDEVVTWHITANDGLTLQPEGSKMLFAFVPAGAGDYKFYCEGATAFSTNAYLYDANMDLLAQWTNEGNDFVVKYPCEQGKTYYLAPIFSAQTAQNEYILHVAPYCEHRYVCTYSTTAEGVRQVGTCEKCGEVWPETVIPLSLSGENASLVTSGDENLTYTFTPQLSGTFAIRYNQVYDYLIFAEIWNDDDQLDYDEEDTGLYRALLFDCQAERTYRIVLEFHNPGENTGNVAQLTLVRNN